MKGGFLNFASWLFPRADEYARCLAQRTIGLRERSPRDRFGPFSERHLQCAWFDSALRPARLVTTDGEEVTVEDPGLWNLEAGPDFLGAALLVGSGRRRLAGDVEVHIHPSDWKTHGHGVDPRYTQVRVHVTYFDGSNEGLRLPPGAIRIALRDALIAEPMFSFDNIDTSAYPFAHRPAAPPCQESLADWPPDAREAILEAAGEERLRRKAERFSFAIAEKGAGQIFYEECLCALGYKNNKAPFRRLAELLPVDLLRREAEGRPLTAYALLMGVAGLLPDKPSARWDDETRLFVRTLWDAWWKKKERWEKRLMPRSAWCLANIRPVNHPVRRLMAAACLFTAKTPLDQKALNPSPGPLVEKWAAMLEPKQITYWDHRLALGGKPQKERISLLGESRIASMLINVLLPFAAAMKPEWLARTGVLTQLPVEAENSVVRQTALNLFGKDHSPSLYRDSLRQQGLIQIFHDFCLNDRSKCARCPFPGYLESNRRMA